MSIFQKDLETIYTAPYGEKHVVDFCNRRWLEMLKEDVEHITELYEVLFDGLDKLIAKPMDVEAATGLFKYLEVFHKGDFIPGILGTAERERLRQLLIELILKIIPYLPKLLTLPNVHLTQTPHWTNEGNISDLVTSVFEIYFYHTPLMEDALRAEASIYVFDAVKAFPKIGGNLVESLIQYHPDAVKGYSEIIAHIMDAFPEIRYEIENNIALSLFSSYVNASDIPYKNLVKIITAVLAKSDGWSAEQIEFFIKGFILSPLGIDKSKEERIREADARITRLIKENRKTYLKEARKEKENLENNYEIIAAKEWEKAYKTVCLKKNFATAIKKIITTLTPHPSTAILQKLIDDAQRFMDTSKKYDLNQKPSVVFKDFALKLLIIEELMYKQGKIEPKFDLEAFASEYLKREIDIEVEGYEPVKEAKKYFQNLDIPQEMLNTITHLIQEEPWETGVYKNLWPFFDPGCGDSLDITNKAADDLSHLLNLKEITGLNFLNPSKKLLKELEKRAITVINIEI